MAVPSVGVAAVATAATGTIAGTPVINGHQVAPGEYILLTAQGDAKQNGVWLVTSSAWERQRADQVTVLHGAGAGQVWALESSANSIETWVQVGASAATGPWEHGSGSGSAQLLASLGAGDNASGTYAVSEGLNTTASGNSSHAEGQSSLAFGLNSHSEGFNSSAEGTASHAEGYQTVAFSEACHSEGESTEALSNYDHSEGFFTVAAGGGAHAEGEFTHAIGTASHAEGTSSEASGPSSHAEGNSTLSSGVGSHSEGNSSHATGDYSHAEGDTTRALATAAHAEGFECQAGSSAYWSHAEGSQSLAYTQGQHAHCSAHADSLNILGTGGGQYTRFVLAGSTPFTGSAGFEYLPLCDSTGAAVWNKRGLLRVRVLQVGNDSNKFVSAWSFEGAFKGDGVSAYSWVAGGGAWSVIAQDSGATSWVHPSLSWVNAPLPTLTLTVFPPASIGIAFTATFEIDELTF